MLITLTFTAEDRDQLKRYLAGEIDSITLDSAIESDGVAADPANPLAPPDPATAGTKKRGRRSKAEIEAANAAAAAAAPTPVPMPAAPTPVPTPAAPTAVGGIGGFTPPMLTQPAAAGPMPVMAMPGMMPQIPAMPVAPQQPVAPADPFDDIGFAMKALVEAQSTCNGQPMNNPAWTEAKGAVLNSAMFFGDIPAQMSQCATGEQRRRFLDRINRFDWLYTIQNSRGQALAAKARAAVDAVATATVASNNIFAVPDAQWPEFKARCEATVAGLN